MRSARALPPFLFITCWFVTPLAFSAEAVTDRDVWQAIADLRITDAQRDLKKAPQDRSTTLAEAVTLIARQPATDGNMHEAEQKLLPLSDGTDEIADQAAYLQARIYQIHLQQPDYAKAAELYTALAARRPQSHWAQLGLVKLALLKLYVLPDSAAAGADRLAPAEALLPQIHEPLLQRDLHLQIGQAGVILKQPLPRFVPHLATAARIGGITGTAREDLIVQVGELSRRAGFLAQAKEFFELYLREYPTNVRAYSAKERLKDIDRQLAAAAGEGAK